MPRKRYRSPVDRYRKELQRNLLAQPGRHSFVLILDGLKAGFNVAKILRTAEVFGAQAVHLVNVGPFDPAPAKGALRKVPVQLFDDFADSYRILQAAGFAFFLLQPDTGRTLTTALLPQKSAFILGHEEFGPSFEAVNYPDIQLVTIPQSGQTQSLNVSVAAGIVMYEYLRQMG
jgi:tRNA G18 (ribose-2'-O)-methylase SpoU